MGSGAAGGGTTRTAQGGDTPTHQVTIGTDTGFNGLPWRGTEAESPTEARRSEAREGMASRRQAGTGHYVVEGAACQVIITEVAPQGLTVTAERPYPGFTPQSHSRAPGSKYIPEASHSQPFHLLPQETHTEHFTKVLVTGRRRRQARRRPTSI